MDLYILFNVLFAYGMGCLTVLVCQRILKAPKKKEKEKVSGAKVRG